MVGVVFRRPGSHERMVIGVATVVALVVNGFVLAKRDFFAAPRTRRVLMASQIPLWLFIAWVYLHTR